MSGLLQTQVTMYSGWQWPLWACWFLALLLALVFLSGVWLISVWKKDASIVDRIWGFGFLVIAAFFFLFEPVKDERRVLNLILVSIWALRLSAHIHRRNAGQGEDPRYAAMRERHPNFALWSLFGVFWLQGFLLSLIALPILVVQTRSGPSFPTAPEMAGLILWITGFLFEAIADFQLSRFKRDPGNRDKVCRNGLWNLSRHPNYFGESLVWWGFFLMAVPLPGGPWSLVSPVLLTFLLLKVSGVSLLEEHLTPRKKGYAEYKRDVPAFLPRWPRSKI